MQTIFMSAPVTGVSFKNSLSLNKIPPRRENPGHTVPPGAQWTLFRFQRGTMLYKFKSRVTGDVIMLEPNGRRVLEILGKDPGAPGIIEAADASAAIHALEAAILKEEADQQSAIEAAAALGEPAPHFEGISLRQRAVPLIDMLRRCEKAGKEVVWGV
jgi:hypothetical protein